MKFDNKPRPPRWADRIFEWYCTNDLAESIQGDLYEKFQSDLSQRGLFYARFCYWVDIFRFINRHTLKSSNRQKSTQKNTFPMIKNYLTVSIRNLLKNKAYAFINIFGLAIGLASCLTIFSYVKKELQFDQFHTKHEQLYRVTNCFERPNRSNHWARTPPALAPAIRTNLPGVEKATRLRYTDELLYTVDDQSFYQGNGFYADSLFLEMFDFTLKTGDRFTALDEPGNIVLTEALALRLFGNKDPMGKIIKLDGETLLKVTGILNPIPSDSHLMFDLLISFPTYVVPEGYLADLNSWNWAGYWTYVQAAESTEAEYLSQQIEELYSANYKNKSDLTINVDLQPLADVYLGSSHYTNIGESVRVGSHSSIIGLGVVAILILFVAGVNFMNLSTAISFRRGKEIGIRKVLGAVKTKITQQFLLESVLVCMISLFFAALLVWFFGPIISRRFDLGIVFSIEQIAKSIPALFVFAFAVGILAGLYPSFILAAFSPIAALRGQLFSKGPNTWLRKSLIVFQFVIAGGLIITSLVVVSQLEFIQYKSLGFNHENIIKLRLSAGAKYHTVLRNKLLNNPSVLSLTRASHSFDGSASSGPAWIKGSTAQDAHQLAYYQTEEDFLKVTGVKVIAGRYFSSEFQTDSVDALVLNQAAVAELGLKDPIGQKINFHNRERKVIGVVEDFHFNSLHTPIGPMGIVMPFVNLEQLLIKVQGDDLGQTLFAIESDWREVAGDTPFEIGFIEDGIQSMYDKEERISTLISGFSTLAVILACLGLYAMVAYSIQNRLKEIGIRKVLGAPILRLSYHLGKNYLFLILIATFITWPLAFVLSNQWLNGFAYRISLDPLLFIVSGLLLFVISLLTIGYQLIKATLTNPVVYLRDE